MRSFYTRRSFVVYLVFILLVIGLSSVFFRNNKTEIISEVSNLPQVNTIGTSVQGRSIKAYTYGRGETHLAFVGGIHGGYEWNSVLLAEQLIDYLDLNPDTIPTNLRITIIPSANPDGVYKVIGKEGKFSLVDVPQNTVDGAGRFNANNVDLNRNFDCKWVPESTWRGNKVNAGTQAFSEPEAKAIRDFALKNNLQGVVFWHSQSNAVYASQCEDGILPITLEIMRVYSLASGYPSVNVFDSYVVTGAADDWLASIGVPALTVELKTHETIEWDKNLAGVKALLKYYQDKSSSTDIKS